MFIPRLKNKKYTAFLTKSTVMAKLWDRYLAHMMPSLVGKYLALLLNGYFDNNNFISDRLFDGM